MFGLPLIIQKRIPAISPFALDALFEVLGKIFRYNAIDWNNSDFS